MLLLKRLSFLKTSLEGHSPRETTEVFRAKASKKRDERIIEIWKNEID